jgi:hypothetical protein
MDDDYDSDENDVDEEDNKDETEAGWQLKQLLAYNEAGWMQEEVKMMYTDSRSGVQVKFWPSPGIPVPLMQSVR